MRRVEFPAAHGRATDGVGEHRHGERLHAADRSPTPPPPALNVPVAYAHWVDPGVCYNRIGYYEVPNSRIVYRTAAGVHSFGIASMISWWGTWYVVHLGAVVRSQPGGIVDAPSAGAGASAPSSTC